MSIYIPPANALQNERLQLERSEMCSPSEFALSGLLGIFPLGVELGKTFPRLAEIAQAGICIDRFKT